ncbi:hypothetical protein PHSY_002848 [Pseudozyma hubeiensis SY62]|uniref:Uncharacterized protein n=1 Tax=Pseudozyma hubeiensis (strain SY62) TaxID=1305764 RepID=R9P1T7_PSEHS|nr:hypothetical protein PHSY_002848 [Pseudozyma hubeiensis SY62]GAC95273.1 hypothetical protein PHSY_002848 [Pseudozyma hubeiensis SY62]
MHPPWTDKGGIRSRLKWKAGDRQRKWKAAPVRLWESTRCEPLVTLDMTEPQAHGTCRRICPSPARSWCLPASLWKRRTFGWPFGSHFYCRVTIGFPRLGESKRQPSTRKCGVFDHVHTATDEIREANSRRRTSKGVVVPNSVPRFYYRTSNKAADWSPDIVARCQTRHQQIKDRQSTTQAKRRFKRILFTAVYTCLLLQG